MGLPLQVQLQGEAAVAARVEPDLGVIPDRAGTGGMEVRSDLPLIPYILLTWVELRICQGGG